MAARKKIFAKKYFFTLKVGSLEFQGAHLASLNCRPLRHLFAGSGHANHEIIDDSPHLVCISSLDHVFFPFINTFWIFHFSLHSHSPHKQFVAHRQMNCQLYVLFNYLSFCSLKPNLDEMMNKKPVAQKGRPNFSQLRQKHLHTADLLLLLNICSSFVNLY